MLSPKENKIKISHDELGDMEEGNLRKLTPKKTLTMKTKRLIDDGNNKAAKRV